jgi:D-lactate dehydrogenase
MEKVPFFTQIPLFASIPDEALRNRVYSRLERKTHDKGDILWRQGEQQPAMILLEKGRIKRVCDGITVDHLGPGKVSGMLHLFQKDPCFATLECEEECVIWWLHEKDFRELLQVEENSLAAHLLQVLSHEVRSYSSNLRRLQVTDESCPFRVVFFDAKPYEQPFFDEANKNNTKGQFKFEYRSERLSETTVAMASGYDAVCLFVNDIANATVVRELAAMGIKLIALRCAGYNNVNLNACKVHDMTVVRVPAYSPYSVAEHAMGLILTLNRKLHKAYNRVKEGNFSLNGLLGFDIHGKTVGIIGTGKIGCCLIDILLGFGCQVLCYDIYQSDYVKSKPNTSYVELDKLFSESDIISLHAPLTESTRYMINEQSIEKMKDGVMIINTSRGALIKTTALIAGLKSKKIGSAGLDVYEEESAYFFEDHSHEVISDNDLARLIGFNNVVITGHQAFFTQEALSNIAATTVQNISLFHFDKKTGQNHPNFVKAEY